MVAFQTKQNTTFSRSHLLFDRDFVHDKISYVKECNLFTRLTCSTRSHRLFEHLKNEIMHHSMPVTINGLTSSNSNEIIKLPKYDIITWLQDHALQHWP